ncbi:MAG: hypothetical protein EPO21_07235 [Chloroflexota bacterium]|nr:MAG: hypothetical protein EPO21_07235 [Chloroflexota bacterium]
MTGLKPSFHHSLLSVVVVLLGLFVIQPILEPSVNRLQVRERSYFWVGVNYPWKSYQDFGTGAWGHSGVSNPTTFAEIDADFANMHAQGIRIIKWRIFNDGRYSPEFDDSGYVTGLDEKFFPDVDAALELARRHDLFLVFTLFASGFWTTDCSVNDVRIGGHANTLLSGRNRASLVDNAVVPLLKHIGRNDRVLAYEIIAEPEWGITGLYNDGDFRRQVPLISVRSMVRNVVWSVHKYAGALTTVESNRPSNMRNWTGLGLDYYSFSWYDWMAPWEPLETVLSRNELDRPVVLGEIPVDSEEISLGQALTTSYRQGLAGAFAWSYWGGDGFGAWSRAQPQYADWARSAWREVDISGGTPLPADDPALVPQPYTYQNLSLGSTRSGVSVELDLAIRDGGQHTVKVYLNDLADKEVQLESGQRLSARPGEASRITASFPTVLDGHVYKVSVGLFDVSGTLVKWFDGLSLVSLRNGQVETPSRSTIQENPCASSAH